MWQEKACKKISDIEMHIGIMDAKMIIIINQISEIKRTVNRSTIQKQISVENNINMQHKIELLEKNIETLKEMIVHLQNK